MWRRVLSQSPLAVPKDAESADQMRTYLNGWKALGVLLHKGGSLSGHERNCCFLNTGTGRFADVSSAVGLDQDADSRGLAALDWDGDGDLDLWVTNRTRPRIRYLQNDFPAGHHFVAFKLTGVRCNRDAIGARVELELESSAARSVGTVAAGEGFVSQTSKWLHFGLGSARKIRRVRVIWPGGETEMFGELPVDQFYELKQGSGRAVPCQRVANSARQLATPSQPIPSQPAQRIVLSRRLPLPRFDYQRLDGTNTDSDAPRGRPALINLWATWCPPCLEELHQWSLAADQWQRTGLQIVALNVDYADQASSSESDDGSLTAAIGDLAEDPAVGPEASDRAALAEFCQGLQLAFPAGIIDGRNLALLEVVERAISLQQEELPVPTSFLLDGEGRVAVVYRGPVALEQLKADLAQLLQPPADPRDAAVPFAGRWLTSPFPADTLSIVNQLLGLQRGAAAREYLLSHVLAPTHVQAIDAWQQLGVTAEKVAAAIEATALMSLKNNRPDDAIELYQKAILYQPENWDLHLRCVNLLMRRQRSAEAIAVSRAMTRLRPNHPLPWNNIAWVLATSNDDSIRDPQKAVELAERVCRSTGYREPSAMDTLAVAYAAAGQLDRAIAMAERAIARFEELEQPAMAQAVRRRLAELRSTRGPRPAPAATKP